MTDNKKTILTIIGISAFMVMSFIHLVNWDKHSFSIIPLKAWQIVGLSNTEDLKKISVICTDRLKYVCAEEALTEVVRATENATDYLNLATLQRKLNKHKLAITNYNNSLAIENHKNKPSTSAISDIRFGLALSHEALSQTEEADKNYNLAIKAKPNVIQVTVTESYIAFLKKENKLDVVKQVITEAQKRGNSTQLFASALAGN